MLLNTLLLVGAAVVLYCTALKVYVVVQLGHRALRTMSLQGYWGDFFDCCAGGRLSFVIALATALVTYLLLIPVMLVGLLARRIRSGASSPKWMA